MTIAEAVKSVRKQAPLDHPPLVRGTRWQAMIVTALIIVGALSPLILGFRVGQSIPQKMELIWADAMDSRTAAAADAIHQPKIVFIGGSNVRFGVDAAGLSRDVGVPVVNYGLHAGMGIEVITQRALQCVKPGDIVVFAPEMSHFRSPTDVVYSDDLRVEFLALHPGPVDLDLQTFPLRQWKLSRARCTRLRTVVEKSLRDGLVAIARRKSPQLKIEPTPYTLDALGPDGTIIFPRPQPRPRNVWSISAPPTSVATMDMQSSTGGTALALLQTSSRENHFSWWVMPPIRVAIEEIDQANMLQLEQHYIDCAVKDGATELMKPGESILPAEDGYDTDYHLNDVGVKLMEKRLAGALEALLPQKKS